MGTYRNRGIVQPVLYPLTMRRTLLLTTRRFMVQLPPLRRVLVTILSPLCRPQMPAIHLPREKHRYNGNHEEGMGVQAKGCQGMVGGVVSRRQEEGQGTTKQSSGQTLLSDQIHATEL